MSPKIHAVLAGATEVAELLSAARSQVVSVRRRHVDSPEPIERLTQALVWDWAEEAWAKQNGRLG